LKITQLTNVGFNSRKFVSHFIVTYLFS